MNNLMKYMMVNNCPIVLDMDGTLTSYNYGKYHAYHELDLGVDDMDHKAFLDAHIYKTVVKPLPIMQRFLKERDKRLIYVLSKEIHGQDDDKTWFANKYYDIIPNHCFYTKTHLEKIDRLKDMQKLFETDLTPVYIDDNSHLLCDVRNNTDYYTAHITLFMEEGLF